MNKRKLIYFLSAFVLIIGCYALNLSYSLFTQNIIPESNMVDSTVPIINASLETNSFTIPANSGEVIKLKINNLSNVDIKYGISINDTRGTIVQLVEGFEIIGNISATQSTNDPISKEVWVYVNNPTDAEVTELTFELSTKYTTISFDESEFIEASKFKKKEDGTFDTMKLLSNSIIARSKSITKIDSKTKGYAIYSETYITTPSESTSESDESLLLNTEDDYTATTGENSYYFRGNVTDNYVTFADMCWRIVRIEGDGSIKIILEDQNQPCSTTMNRNWSNGNKYVFGYDDDNRADFINYTNSDGLQNSFKTFQTLLTTKISEKYVDKTISDKLKIDEWCYDDIVTSTDDYGNEYYGAYTRIYKNKKPSLKCSGAKLTNFKDTTDMYVGTLTADEMSFAGAYYGATNYNYYLMNNSEKDKNLSWWSLSPYYFYKGDSVDLAFFLGYYGGLVNYGVDNNDGFSRPAVTLKFGSVILGGEGTIEKPYIIG